MPRVKKAEAVLSVIKEEERESEMTEFDQPALQVKREPCDGTSAISKREKLPRKVKLETSTLKNEMKPEVKPELKAKSEIDVKLEEEEQHALQARQSTQIDTSESEPKKKTASKKLLGKRTRSQAASKFLDTEAKDEHEEEYETQVDEERMKAGKLNF